MKNKYFLIVIFATVVTILIWAVSDLVHSRVQTETSPDTQQLLQPIDSNFDQQALDEL